MKTIKAGETLTCRSVCDHNCIFELKVIEVKGMFATVSYLGNVSRKKIRIDHNGDQFVMPENYSMAPVFKAV